MPTKKEFNELCTSDKIESRVYMENYKGSGVNGWLFTATNGNSIFMPHAGCRNDPLHRTDLPGRPL